MSKQHRHNAPEAPKAPGAAEKPPEAPALPDAPVGAAPEAPKAPGDGAAAGGEEPAADGESASDGDESEPDDEHELECPACIALNGERPCSLECYVAAGYTAEGYAERFGTPPDSSAQPVVEDAPPGFVAPPGKVHCRAITTCLVRGMPEFSGAEFWLEEHEAERLESKGALEIVAYA